MAFTIDISRKDDVVKITLGGELDATSADAFREKIEEAARLTPQRLVILADQLTFMASAGLRALIFAKQKMGENVSVFVVGAKGPVLRTLTMSGFHHAIHLQDTYAE